jgi:hypothetical protein
MPDASAPDRQPRHELPPQDGAPKGRFSPRRAFNRWLNFMLGRAPAVTGRPEPLIVGKIYRLQFPGIAVRVIEAPPGGGSRDYPFLVESLVLRSRWYVNALGQPDNINSPLMVIPVRPHRGDGATDENSTMVWDQ